MRPSCNVRSALLRVVAVLWLGIAGVAVAQERFPTRPVKLVVAFPPGGSTDVTARVIAGKLEQRWGQFGRFVRDEIETSRRVAAAAGVKPE